MNFYIQKILMMFRVTFTRLNISSWSNRMWTWKRRKSLWNYWVKKLTRTMYVRADSSIVMLSYRVTSKSPLLLRVFRKSSISDLGRSQRDHRRQSSCAHTAECLLLDQLEAIWTSSQNRASHDENRTHSESKTEDKWNGSSHTQEHIFRLNTTTCDRTGTMPVCLRSTLNQMVR